MDINSPEWAFPLNYPQTDHIKDRINYAHDLVVEAEREFVRDYEELDYKQKEVSRMAMRYMIRIRHALEGKNLPDLTTAQESAQQREKGKASLPFRQPPKLQGEH